LDVVLVRPEIPGNTGNIIRLCANVGASLHLVEPLGFVMENRLLKRAGLDYHDLTEVIVHADAAACVQALGERRRFLLTAGGPIRYDAVAFDHDDVLVFGSETNGISQLDAETIAPSDRLHLPMMPNNRSLNLANAVAVVLYEAWRQLEFTGSSVTDGVRHHS
jgi:tRNA (cytidine/uridine-2'-O-)-methyltransferase